MNSTPASCKLPRSLAAAAAAAWPPLPGRCVTCPPPPCCDYRLVEGHKQPLYCGAFNHWSPLLADLVATVGSNRVRAAARVLGRHVTQAAPLRHATAAT